MAGLGSANVFCERYPSCRILCAESDQPEVLIELGKLDDDPPVADPDVRDSTGGDLVVDERS
jgi:hypothetical protein